MSHAGPSAALSGGPKPVTPMQSDTVQSKRDLTSWWKQFKRSDRKAQEQPDLAPPPGIFGVPLQTSIRYANVAISLFNEDGQSYIYGYVPIVVAKCGVFLKEKATDVEGIFRLAGSEKRIKDLKVAFDSPDRYGKGLDWSGYTVHDAANILRRYFNQLPEPIIPLDFYERFRDPLRNHQAQAVGSMDAQSPALGDFDHEKSIRIYQALITELPPLNRQLLLYILDLLAVFASKSDENRMTTPNLAAIFQPGLLSHPQHDMAPQEYRLSQDVLIFLIEHQDSFLIGMPGTATDQETLKDVESGGSGSKPSSTPTTPNRSKTVIGRSSSGASAGDGRWSNLRRNVSTSSRHSKRSEAGPTPVSPLMGSLTPAGSVHRSNTVPSRRTGSAAASPRFSRDKHSDPSTPSRSSPVPFVQEERAEDSSMTSTPTTAAAPALSVPTTDVTSGTSSEATTPLATVGSDRSIATMRDVQTPKKDTTPLLGAPASTAERSRATDRQVSVSAAAAAVPGLLNVFKQYPGSDSESRKPNKLQKKRTPGSPLPSGRSSTQSLTHPEQEQTRQSPVTPGFEPRLQHDSPVAAEHSNYATASTTPVKTTPQRMLTDATVKPRTTSPPHSFTSRNSITDHSDADMVGDDMPAQPTESTEKQKRKHRSWFSRNQNKLEQPGSPPPPKSRATPYDAMSPKEQAMSRSTIGSSSAAGSQPRRSFQEPVSLGSAVNDFEAPTMPQSAATDSSVFSDSEREKKGPMGWIRSKIQERKDKDAEKRTRTPERSGRQMRDSRQDLRTPSQSQAGEHLPVRGKSIEQPRTASNAAAVVEEPRVTSAGSDATQVPTQVTEPLAPLTEASTTSDIIPQGQLHEDLPATAAASVPLERTNSVVEQGQHEQRMDAEMEQRIDAVLEGRR